jgi:hypothetical protein
MPHITSTKSFDSYPIAPKGKYNVIIKYLSVKTTLVIHG